MFELFGQTDCAFRQRHRSVCDLITILSNLFVNCSTFYTIPDGFQITKCPDGSRFPLRVILNPLKITDMILGEK